MLCRSDKRVLIGYKLFLCWILCGRCLHSIKIIIIDYTDEITKNSVKTIIDGLRW